MSAYLRHIRIDSFGAYFERVVGPFSPGLNVVYGENEAGKTTIASFVGGVLFGWEEARGSRNTYKPANADRAGALFFAETAGEDGVSPEPNDDGSSREKELFRGRNADGLQGAVQLVDDIDRETYRTMFSLDSDELRSLRNTTDITARLLTAGSGTGESPAAAFNEVEHRIASYTSRAAGATDSIVRLNEQLEEKRAQINEANEQIEQFKNDDREYRELERSRTDVAERIAALNDDIQKLVTWKERLSQIDASIEDSNAELDRLRKEADSLDESSAADQASLDERLINLDAASERSLRDRLDVLADEQSKAAHSVDLARENSSNSDAAWEAFSEINEPDNGDVAPWRHRKLQIIIAIVLTLVFLAAGIPLFMHGREITSLSFTAMGIFLIMFALVLAMTATIMSFRSDRSVESVEERRKDVQWVMLQDRKKLQSCIAAKEKLDEDIAREFAEKGLADAGSSVRQARALLDEAAQVRSRLKMADQRAASLELRMANVEATLSDLDLQRARTCAEADLREGEGTEVLDARLKQKTAQRTALLKTTEKMNERYGELGRELADAKLMQSFDQLKNEYQQLITRVRESRNELASLLLARRLLERSIASWESRSQPEVYREASRLLSLMTNGRWVQVELTSDGVLAVTDAMHNVRSPQQLSLGTCQQLYLALRIALLMNADMVGRAIPVLADDILVNFDEKRRTGAAKALAELAERRQVILFTCHKEVVESVRAAYPSLTLIEL